MTIHDYIMTRVLYIIYDDELVHGTEDSRGDVGSAPSNLEAHTTMNGAVPLPIHPMVGW